MTRTAIALGLAASLCLGACAQQPDKIDASYVSPNTYRGMSCQQMAAERSELQRKVKDLSASQKSAANTDAVATGLAMMLFFPAAIAIASTKDSEPALSSAKGHLDAVTARMKAQGCPLTS